ncbi:hypothetical protein DXG01_005513 [Tephrocybe rancida]|nr:hypothetical protein DXG01_005513 [Tephrocybe rancida]
MSYKQVPSFGDASEYASDEEEDVLYVTLDLGSIEPSLVPSSSTYRYRLIGLDTPAPFLQLSGTILKGRHETLLGSEILFTDPPDKRSLTPLTPPTTSTRICFSEVRLLPKGTAAPSPSSVLSVSPSMTTTTSSSFPLSSPGPYTTSTSKRRTRKGKEQDAQESWPATADTASLLLDCMTGKNAPHARYGVDTALDHARGVRIPHPTRRGSRVLHPPSHVTTQQNTLSAHPECQSLLPGCILCYDTPATQHYLKTTALPAELLFTLSLHGESSDLDHP